ncbi:MAG: hypothetical protein ACTHMJ_07355 [Thermomicrobiales bacterium]|jgi:hypothetical protein|nr:hypothetical protein [Thermomicrobiales bacterium]
MAEGASGTANGAIPGPETMALLVVTLACTVAARIIFQRRNIVA